MGVSSSTPTPLTRIVAPPLDVSYQLLRHACTEGEVTKALEILSSGQVIDPQDSCHGLGKRNFASGLLACCVQNCKTSAASHHSASPSSTAASALAATAAASPDIRSDDEGDGAEGLMGASASASASDAAAASESESVSKSPCAVAVEATVGAEETSGCPNARIVGEILRIVPDAKRANLLTELDDKDQFPLQVACLNSCEMCVESLCDATLPVIERIHGVQIKDFTGFVGPGLAMAAVNCSARGMDGAMRKILTFLASKSSEATQYIFAHALEQGALSCAKFMASTYKIPTRIPFELIAAAGSGKPEIAAWVLDTRCPASSSVAQLDPGRKALIRAIESYSAPLMELLIERGADVHIPNLYSKVLLPMQLKRLADNPGILTLLYKHGGVEVAEMEKILEMALNTNRLEFVEALLSTGVRLTSNHFRTAVLFMPTKLTTIINYLDLPLCPELINTAVSSKQAAVVRALLAHYAAKGPVPPSVLSLPGAFPDTTTSLSQYYKQAYPLQLALHIGAAEVCLELLSDGATFETVGSRKSSQQDLIVIESFLMYLTQRPDLRVVDSMITHYPQVLTAHWKPKEEYGSLALFGGIYLAERYSALAIAAELGLVQVAQLLISKGIQPTHTSLCCAVQGCASSCGPINYCEHCFVAEFMMRKGHAVLMGSLPQQGKCARIVMFGHWQQISISLLLSRHPRCGAMSRLSVVQETPQQLICLFLKPKDTMLPAQSLLLLSPLHW
ncbi:hypothetical protein Pelo_565 [Pelomyxa schiedti]|nr:hypothetical protein Pelo_565 [Pelomyxa schiedti]